MATGPEHYTEAERLAEIAEQKAITARDYAEVARVHALLSRSPAAHSQFTIAGKSATFEQVQQYTHELAGAAWTLVRLLEEGRHYEGAAANLKLILRGAKR